MLRKMKKIIVDVEESFPCPVWLDKISPFVSAVLDDLALEDWSYPFFFVQMLHCKAE